MKHYFSLIKPGIVAGNLISIIGGFLLASQGNINIVQGLWTALGISLIVASGCVCNNHIDKDIDGKMARTKNRALVKGDISPLQAILYAAALGIVGVIALRQATTYWLPFILVSIGFVIYVGVYSLYMKRHSIYGTIVGSFSGAAPPVVSYCVVTHSFDTGAAILLLIFCLWQIPHSYAIALYRLNDYKMAGIPVLPAVQGVNVTKRHIVIYILLFIIAELMLSFTGYTGKAYLIAALLSGLYWLWLGISGFNATDDRLWARKIFTFSIVIVFILSIMMSVDTQIR